jgi:plasmid stabilization system protein ParE
VTSLRVARAAVRQTERALAWWALHRPEAPDLVRHELASAISLLKAAPKMGAPYPPGVRRVLLPESRYQLFYVYDEAANRIDVIALWSSHRRPPALRGY